MSSTACWPAMEKVDMVPLKTFERRNGRKGKSDTLGTNNNQNTKENPKVLKGNLKRQVEWGIKGNKYVNCRLKEVGGWWL